MVKKIETMMGRNLIDKSVAGLTVLVLVGMLFHAGPDAYAGTENEIQVVEGTQHKMIIDRINKELRITSTVTKDCSKPGVCDFGRRFQAFFGMKGGKMEKYFVFTTDVPRSEINKAIQELGVVSRNQIPMEEVETRRGLSKYTKNDDYLNGDPIIVTARFKKDGKFVEVALEDLIDERINVEGSEIFKPYTANICENACLKYCFIPAITVMFRREVFLKTGFLQEPGAYCEYFLFVHDDSPRQTKLTCT